MNFLSTSILSAFSTAIKLGSNLIINKIVAIYIGPSGIALIGQFQNFLAIVKTIASGATNSGVTKYVAEYNEDHIDKRNSIIQASLVIAFFSSIIIGFIIFVWSDFFSAIVLNTEEYSIVFKFLGALLLLISVNSILLSVINGLKNIKLFITINIVSSLLSLIIMTVLTIKYAVIGALLSSIFVQALVLVITLLLSWKKIGVNINFIAILFNPYKKLFKFSLMAAISIFSLTFSQFLIRNYLMSEFSLREAGYWQSVWLISSMYLMILTTAFSTYYLPKLSELKNKRELRAEILSGYKIILPFVAFSALLIFLLKDLIISVLFTPEFQEMRSLFLFQLLGDFFKMASWTLAFLMIAKAMTKIYVITEIWFAVQFYVLTLILTKINGLIGVTEAYALNYFIYLIVMIYLFRGIIFVQSNKSSN